MNKIKKYLHVVFSLVLILFASSCARFNFKLPEKIAIATESAPIIEVDNYGDKLQSLEGDVATLADYPLPKVGEKMYGFNVDAIYDFEYRNAKIVVFSHEKSGAKAMLISNDDEDKAAMFGFNTLTYDNKGIPHVFEHACLGGSTKYPNANLWDEATSKTYKTFMNAITMQHVTHYPFSSLSDAQLFELYKLYLDGVLDPDVLRSEKNLEREAYRYILYDKKDDIDLSGVVYSEMSGVEGSLINVSFRNTLKAMFEGSYMGVNTGGDTADIPKIKNEELVSFHNKYYHPSNMIITLYGNLDYEKYLKYSDEEYLSKYDKTVIDKSDDNYKKQNSFITKKFDFPFSENDEIENQTVIVYSVICEDLSQYESGLFTSILNSLSRNDGPIDRRIKEKLPNANFDCENCLYMPKPFFSMFFTNVNEKDADLIKEIVEESFAEIVEQGINKEIIEEIVDDLEIEMENSKDSHGFARAASTFYGMTFANNGEDILGYLRYFKGLGDTRAAYDKGDIDKLLKKYLSNNDHSSLTLTVPKRGLLEEKIKNKQNELQEMKTNMSDAELDELIQKNIDFDEWAEYQISHSMIDKLRVASVSSLDEYRAKCYAYEETSQGIHFIRSEIRDTKINYFNLLFDASGVKYEDTLKLKLISNLLLQLPTSNYPGKKLASEFSRYMASYNAAPSTNYYFDGGYKPYFSFSAMSLDKNIDKVFDLMEELMFETKFEDVNIVRNVVSSTYNNYKMSCLNSPSDYAEKLVNAQNNEDYLYDFHMNGTDYLDYLKKVSSMSDEEIKALLDECKDLLIGLYNRSGFVCQIISNYDTVKVLKNKVIDLSYDFKDERIKPVDYSEYLKPLKSRIAIISNGTVQYNYISMPMQKNNIEYKGQDAVLSSILNSEILFPEFRVKRSAYGSYSLIDRFNNYIYTYRDPNLKESYEVFKSIPGLLKNVKISAEGLEDYKLNAYTAFSYPLTKFKAAEIAISETFKLVKEKRPDRYVRHMKEIKATTLDDLPELYKSIDKLIEEGKYVTIGSREQIEANKDMFDEIIYDYVQ